MITERHRFRFLCFVLCKGHKPLQAQLHWHWQTLVASCLPHALTQFPASASGVSQFTHCTCWLRAVGLKTFVVIGVGRHDKQVLVLILIN